jgi:hypothetical protein
MITAPSSWNSASVVAGALHEMQNPAAFLLLVDAGLVLIGFTTVYKCRGY